MPGNDKTLNEIKSSFFTGSAADKSSTSETTSETTIRRARTFDPVNRTPENDVLEELEENEIKRFKSLDDVAKSQTSRKSKSRLAKKRKWHNKGAMGSLKRGLKRIKRGFKSIGKTSEEKFKLFQEDFLIYTVAHYILGDNNDDAAKKNWEEWCKDFMDRLDSMIGYASDRILDDKEKVYRQDIAGAANLPEDDPLVWWVRNVTGHVSHTNKNDDIISEKIEKIKENLRECLWNLTATKVLETCAGGQSTVSFNTYSGGPSDHLVLRVHFDKFLQKIQSWLKSSISRELKLGPLGYSFVASALSKNFDLVGNFRIMKYDTVDKNALCKTLEELDKLLSSEERTRLRRRLIVSLKQGIRVGEKNLEELSSYIIECSGFSPNEIDRKWRIYKTWKALFDNDSFPLSEKEWAKTLKKSWQEFDKNNKIAEENKRIAEENKRMAEKSVIAVESLKNGTSTTTEVSLSANGIDYTQIPCKDLIWTFDSVKNYSDKSNDPFLRSLNHNQSSFAKHVGYCLKLAETPKLYYDYVNGENGMTDEKGNRVSDVTVSAVKQIFTSRLGKGSTKADLDNYCQGVANLLEEDLKKYKQNVNWSSFQLPQVDEKEIVKSYTDLSAFASKELDEIKNKGVEQLNSSVKNKLQEYFVTDIKMKINRELNWENVFESISSGSMDSEALKKEKISPSVPQINCVLSFVEQVIGRGGNILNELEKKVLPIVKDKLFESLVKLKKSFSNAIEKGYFGKKAQYADSIQKNRSEIISKFNKLLGSTLK